MYVCVCVDGSGCVCLCVCVGGGGGGGGVCKDRLALFYFLTAMSLHVFIYSSRCVCGRGAVWVYAWIG